MDTLNSQIFLDDNLILPESIADNIIYSDTTLKNAFDNYNPITMSNFGKNICKCSSLADVCRLFHINYFFAKDIIDNVVWNITGNPTVDNQKLHSTNANYIYRTFALGAYDLEINLDLTCSDSDKVIFQIFDNTTATGGGVYRHRIKLVTDSNGIVYFRYTTQQDYHTGSGVIGWYSENTVKNISVGDCSTKKHIKIFYHKLDNSWSIYLNGSLIQDYFTYNMSARSWLVYLGLTADCTFDNFKLTYNSNIISELDFD